MRKKMIKKCEESLANRWSFRLKTKQVIGDNYDGVILSIKDSFIVLREERDFEFDGIIILVKNVVKSCRDGRFERCSNEILKINGEFEKLEKLEWVNKCESIKQILEEMMIKDIWPGIEVLYKLDNGFRTAFFLGPITYCGKKTFILKCYDAGGRWEKVYEIKYNEVFRIEFDSKYCNHFNHYMKNRDNA